MRTDFLRMNAQRAGIDVDAMDEVSLARLSRFADSIAKLCGDRVGLLGRQRQRQGISETTLEFAAAAAKNLQDLFATEPLPSASGDVAPARGIWYSKSEAGKAAIREAGIHDVAFHEIVNAWLGSPELQYLFVGTKGGSKTEDQIFTLVGEDEEDLLTVCLEELAAFMSKSALPESFVTAIDKDLAGKLELAWPKIVAKSGH